MKKNPETIPGDDERRKPPILKGEPNKDFSEGSESSDDFEEESEVEKQEKVIKGRRGYVR